MRVHFIERDATVGQQQIDRCDEGVVRVIKACEHVVDHISLGDEAAGRSKLVSETLDMAKIISHVHVLFLGVRKLPLKLHDPGARLRGVHALECRPYLRRGREVQHARDDLGRERGEDPSKEQLILGVPDRVGWVDHHLRPFGGGDRGVPEECSRC